MFNILLSLFYAKIFITKNSSILYNGLENIDVDSRNKTLTNNEIIGGMCDIPGDIDTIDELIKINTNYHKYKILKTLENKDVSVYDKILLELKKERLENMCDLTPQKLREILKII